MPARPIIHPADPFLPDLLPAERELLRLEITRGFQSGTLSLRSRRDPVTGGWRHRLVDEYGTDWRVRPARTVRPLDAARTLALLDSATRPGAPFDGRDFPGALWAALRLDEIAGALVVRAARWPAIAQALARREAGYLARWGHRTRSAAVPSTMRRTARSLRHPA